MARKARDNPLKGSAEHIAKLSSRRDSKFMSGMLVVWALVVKKVYTKRPPSPNHLIIREKRRALLEITIGWIAYPSSKAESWKRMQPRLIKFFGLIEKKMKRRKKASAIRGVAAAPITIKIGHK